MQYRAYPKQALCATMAGTPGPNIFDVSKWPQWWEAGAKQLEKTSPGQIITAPIRLPAAVLTSATKTVQELPGTVRTVSRAIPILAISAAVIGSAYLVYKFKKDNKNVIS